MANITVEQDKPRFAEWKSQRHQRQASPALWRFGCNHISTFGITPVTRKFHLNDNKLCEKATQAAAISRRINTQV